MSNNIWCPNHKNEDRHPRVEKDGFYHCGDCDTKIVNIAAEGCCVACGKYARGKFHCENCYQWMCGRHTEKRSVHGFSIWGCPTCHGLSEPRKEWMKDEFKGSYTGFRFVWNKEKGLYEWDGDLSLCFYDKTVLPSRRKYAKEFREELEKFKKYKIITGETSKLIDFIDVEKAEQWLTKYESHLN